MAIYRGIGTTHGERRLAAMLENSFLDYWTVANPIKKIGSQKTELCDALVVCGDFLLIFQHKQIKLDLGDEPSVEWEKWFRKSCVAAEKQLMEAKKAICNPNTEFFLDPKCEHRFHLKVPNWDSKRCFLIAALGDNVEAAQNFFGADETTFAVCSQVPKYGEKGFDLTADVAFLPQGGDGNEFVHNFEDRSLALLLQELDTVADFCAYLHKREEFFRRHKNIVATSEDELLWLYSSQLNEQGDHDFVLPKSYKNGDSVYLDSGSWNDFTETAFWKRKKQADSVSYFWDRLIKQFAKNKLSGAGLHWSPAGKELHEGGIRYLALESRLIRRYLSNRLVKAFDQCPAGAMNRTLILSTGSPHSSNATYVILQLPVPLSVEYERYRILRRQLLVEHIWAAKIRCPSAGIIVGIAFEPPKYWDTGMKSEDMLLFENDYWTEENLSIASASAEETGYFSKAAMTEVKEREFPN